MANYYQVLGLTQDATLEDIKRAYRSLAKQYHSDKNKSDSATKLFQEINRAYQILTHRGPVDLRKWAIFNTILMSPKSWLSQEDLDAGCEHSMVPVDS